uniref:Uncharacterized protein n=1 Tax=Solanum lycopersicum TaxID=4081 RepID=A0A3Q7I9A9_SOLLC
MTAGLLSSGMEIPDHFLACWPFCRRFVAFFFLFCEMYLTFACLFLGCCRH